MKKFHWRPIVCLSVVMAVFPLSAVADAGTVKTVRGDAVIERGGQRSPAAVGTAVQSRDRIVTGADGSVGITLTDGTLLSAGPRSTLDLQQYVFDRSTLKGRLDAQVQRGTVAVVSGQMASHDAGQVVFRARSVTLGVRGTEFIIDVPAGEP